MATTAEQVATILREKREWQWAAGDLMVLDIINHSPSPVDRERTERTRRALVKECMRESKRCRRTIESALNVAWRIEEHRRVKDKTWHWHHAIVVAADRIGWGVDRMLQVAQNHHLTITMLRNYGREDTKPRKQSMQCDVCSTKLTVTPIAILRYKGYHLPCPVCISQRWLAGDTPDPEATPMIGTIQ